MDAIGTRRHLVTVEDPGTPVKDNDGGYTVAWTPLIPSTWAVSMTPATARDLERITVGTVLSTATHIVKGRYHPQITVKTRLTKGPRKTDGTLATGSREFSVTGVLNTEEKNIETVALCVEIVS
jgi:Phage head-tail joining protein